MAQDIGFTVQFSRAANTRRIGKREKCAVDSSDKSGRLNTVSYAS
ncbi:MAG: hypothetical protein ACI8W7_001397 [Gammaproteobacteria bacterium]|jgi:hypothetical protein